MVCGSCGGGGSCGQIWTTLDIWLILIGEKWQKISRRTVVVVWCGCGLWFSSDYNTYPSLDFDFEFDQGVAILENFKKDSGLWCGGL